MPSQIGAQLYTLREFTKTPTDIAKTLARVKKMGYDAVQASALGPIDPKELAKILHDEGLVCAATHLPIERTANEAEKVIEEHHLWGCKYTAVGGFFQKQFVTQDWLDFSAKYNDIASKFVGFRGSPSAITTTAMRWCGTTASRRFTDPGIEKLDPSIWFEIDTYWITHGGGDPAQWIEKVKGRIPCVHVKDMAITTDRTQYMAEVGVGNLNWPRILQACKSAGVKWYLVEQDVCYRDPFDSLETSLNNLKEMGLEWGQIRNSTNRNSKEPRNSQIRSRKLQKI